jgi:hypothetical protein
MSVQDAIDALRLAGYRPGVATAGHPARGEIKAALKLLREHGVDVVRALEGALVDRPPRCPLCGGDGRVSVSDVVEAVADAVDGDGSAKRKGKAK